MNDSTKLAKFWLELETIKTKLDNDLIPVGGYLRVDDNELIESMKKLSKAIETHFSQFKLTTGKQN